MPYGQGMFEAVYGGFESSFKVLPGTVNAVKTSVINPRFEPDVNRFQSEALDGSPDPNTVIDGKIGVRFSFDAELSKESATMPLKGLCGTPISAGTTGYYDHYYTLGTMLSMFFEQRHTDVSQNFAWKGCYIGQASIGFESEGICQGTFSGMGAIQINEGSSTVINGTIQDKTGEEPLNYINAVLKEGGVTLGYVQSCSIDVDRRLDKRNHMDGTNEVGVIFGQKSKVGGTLKASFQDKDLLDKALNSTELKLEIQIFSAGHGLWVLCPTVKLKPAAPITNGTGLADLDFRWDAYRRGTASNIAGEACSKYIGSGTFGGLDTLTLSIKVDGGAPQVVTFEAADDTLTEIVAEINNETTGCTAVEENGRVVIRSDTKGSTSSIQVEAVSTADTLLGFDNAVHVGWDSKAILFRVSNASATVQ